MNGSICLRIGLAAAIALVATGCANNREQERIIMLEGQNRDLTARLNRTMGEMGTLNRERGNWDQALAAARREADGLRAQLASIPEPVETAPGWTAVPGGAMIALEGSVLFAPGKTTIRNEAKRALDGVVSAIQGDYDGKDILVFGHTDTTPIRKSGWKDNWQLSTERALAVVRYLESKGVSAGRLAACGCGEHRPRSDTSSDTGRAKNRRVEIFAIEPQANTGRS